MYWVVLLRLTSATLMKDGSLAHRKAFIRHTPDGLLGWMMQAVHGAGADIKADRLGSWTLRPSGDQQRLELRRESPEEYVYLQQAPTPLQNKVDMSYRAHKAADVEVRRLK